MEKQWANMYPESYLCLFVQIQICYQYRHSLQGREFDCTIVLINAGDLHWKIVSVYINRLNQVSLSMLKPKALSDYPLEILFT